MKSLIKLSKEQIIVEVNKDLLTRDSDNIENLKKFYFKILTEPEIRTSSFRYVYAKIAFEVICNNTNDTQSLDEFNGFNKDKVMYEIANPVVKEVKEVTKSNRVINTNQKFGNAIKSTNQFKI